MPHIILTIGDPTGIGAEIAVKTLLRLHELKSLDGPFKMTILGSIQSLEKSAQEIGQLLPQDPHIHYQAILANTPGGIAYQGIETAVEMLAKGEADALVTGPISKHNLKEAGHPYSGHTEILEILARRYYPDQTARAEMLFIYKNLRLLLLTRHISLKEVPDALAQQGAVVKPLKTLIAFLRHNLKIDHPRIALLGLNPHAGEISGDEEIKIFKPIIQAVNGIGGSHIDGPLAADAFFRSFDASSTPYDAIVSGYHDQGLIPFKMLAGYEAVNVTIGLPFIRTSVSHGTAEDIVGKGIASEASLITAIQAALLQLRGHSKRVGRSSS